MDRGLRLPGESTYNSKSSSITYSSLQIVVVAGGVGGGGICLFVCSFEAGSLYAVLAVLEFTV